MCVDTLNDAEDETSLQQIVLFSATLFRYVAEIGVGKKIDDQVFDLRFSFELALLTCNKLNTEFLVFIM